MTVVPGAPNRFALQECLLADDRVQRWRAFDKELGREVWLDWPGEGRATGAGADRAMREARMLARVRDPSVVRLLEVVGSPGQPVLVLEPVHGPTLESVLVTEGRLDPEQVIVLGRRLALASSAVHAAGVVHRGIAPCNVIFPSAASAVLIGFTFAKPMQAGGATSLDHGGGQRREGRVLPDYSAPEQILGHAADARSDIFALGCLLHRCVTGSEYRGAEAGGRCDVAEPAGLARVLERCLSTSPSARYPNMLELDAALAALGERPIMSTSRRSSIALILGAALVVVAVIAALRLPGSDAKDSGASPADPDTNPAAFAPRFSGSRALLVGIDYAEDPDRSRLRNPERDVTAIAERLVGIGWPRDRVKLLLGRAATEAAIVGELRALELAGPEEQVFVYLAGHGELGSSTDDLTGYFIPADGGPSGLGPQARAHWIPFDLFRNELGEMRAKHAMVVLDCCHAGAALRGRRPDDSRLAPARPIAEHVRRRSRTLLCSALAEEYASDGSADHSPFATGLLHALEPAMRGGVVLGSEIHLAATRELLRVDAAQCCWRRTLGRADAEFVFLPRD